MERGGGEEGGGRRRATRGGRGGGETAALCATPSPAPALQPARVMEAQRSAHLATPAGATGAF